MTPRSIIRWKSFWFGILMLGFLGWAWWDSSNYTTGFQWKEIAVGTTSSNGVLVIRDSSAKKRWQGRRNAARPYPRNWEPRALLVSPIFVKANVDPSQERIFSDESDHASNLKEWEQAKVNDYGMGSWSVFLPYWLLVLFFLIPWLGFLFWRVGNQKKPAP